MVDMVRVCLWRFSVASQGGEEVDHDGAALHVRGGEEVVTGGDELHGVLHLQHGVTAQQAPGDAGGGAVLVDVVTCQVRDVIEQGVVGTAGKGGEEDLVDLRLFLGGGDDGGGAVHGCEAEGGKEGLSGAGLVGVEDDDGLAPHEQAAELANHVGNEAGYLAGGGEGAGAIRNICPWEITQQAGEGANGALGRGGECLIIGEHVAGVDLGAGVVALGRQADSALAGGGIRMPDGEAHGDHAAQAVSVLARDVGGEYFIRVLYAEALKGGGITEFGEAHELLHPCGEAAGCHLHQAGLVLEHAVGGEALLDAYGEEAAIAKEEAVLRDVAHDGACERGDG